jgi:hypothetical protein
MKTKENKTMPSKKTKSNEKGIKMKMHKIATRKRGITVRVLYGSIEELEKDEESPFYVSSRLDCIECKDLWADNPVVVWPANWINRVRERRGILEKGKKGRAQK